MTTDTTSISREAQFLMVEISRGYGSPPYFADWEPLYDAKVESVIGNINATPSEAVFYLPAKRWDENVDINHGDKIKISYLDDTLTSKILFVGFITKKLKQFSGGTQTGGKYERLGFLALDIRWLIASSVPIYGQIGIGADDTDATGIPFDGEYTHFGGRRCIFNPDGIPNRHTEGVTIDDIVQPCFVNPDLSDLYSINWNFADITKYILGPAILKDVSEYISIDPDNLFDNNSSDWVDWVKIKKDISLEGLNPMSALQLICKEIGWAFRISYENSEDGEIVLFKAGKNDVKHSLFSPAPIDSDAPDSSKNIKTAVEAGKIPVFAAQFEEDIANIVNAPLCLGAPLKVEFTAQLVPAWLDEDLVPDMSDNNANLFFSETDLLTLENPKDYSFYKYYHFASSQCKRDVGRIWSLNETGKYSLYGTYNRGDVFDLATILPHDYAYDSNGKKAFGFFDHHLLPCMTQIMQNQSVGILVEFSFDSGSNWYKIPASIISLDGEAGIHITEANLSEIKPNPVDNISGGDLDGIELNYWTSLCRDKLAGGEFSTWQTRLRITAAIQLERRMQNQLFPVSSGSPFYLADVVDVSNSFFKQQRHASSQYSASEMPVDERNDYEEFNEYMDKLKKTLEDTSISGRFILERLWLGTFNIGDGIEKIEGRDYGFKTSLGNQTLYPEIVQIIYLVQQQKMQLITRDLRYSQKR